MTDPDENAQVTKTLKGGEGKLITQRDECNNAEIQRKPTPNKRAKMAGVWGGVCGKEITGFIEMTMGKETEGRRLGQMCLSRISSTHSLPRLAVSQES